MKRLSAGAVAGLLLLAGCGGQGGSTGSTPDLSSGGEQGSSAPATSGAGGEAATGTPIDLDLTAPAVLGADIDLSDYAGQDLALWFWAPW